MPKVLVKPLVKIATKGMAKSSATRKLAGTAVKIPGTGEEKIVKQILKGTGHKRVYEFTDGTVMETTDALINEQCRIVGGAASKVAKEQKPSWYGKEVSHLDLARKRLHRSLAQDWYHTVPLARRGLKIFNKEAQAAPNMPKHVIVEQKGFYTILDEPSATRLKNAGEVRIIK